MSIKTLMGEQFMFRVGWGWLFIINWNGVGVMYFWFYLSFTFSSSFFEFYKWFCANKSEVKVYVNSCKMR